MGLLDNIRNASNWNIGFCDMTPEELVAKRRLSRIQWMRHPYRDRFFADPFILDVSDNEVVVLAEEYCFDSPPGLIVELRIDRATKVLLTRYELLRLPTHLSYPAIMRYDGKVYVYPENGMSGRLKVYRYNGVSHRLEEPICILDEAVADATMFFRDGSQLILVATRYPQTQAGLYIYSSSGILSDFSLHRQQPLQTSLEYSRPAGNFFKVGTTVYRPAQNCGARYGSAISVMKFDPDTLEEDVEFTLLPASYRYNLGLHTINFHQGLCAVDGYGYLYPALGRMYASRFVAGIRDLAKRLRG